MTTTASESRPIPESPPPEAYTHSSVCSRDLDVRRVLITISVRTAYLDASLAELAVRASSSARMTAPAAMVARERDAAASIREAARRATDLQVVLVKAAAVITATAAERYLRQFAGVILERLGVVMRRCAEDLASLGFSARAAAVTFSAEDSACVACSRGGCNCPACVMRRAAETERAAAEVGA